VSPQANLLLKFEEAGRSTCRNPLSSSCPVYIDVPLLSCPFTEEATSPKQHVNIKLTLLSSSVVCDGCSCSITWKAASSRVSLSNLHP
jgi:hypothetical protein